MEKNRKHLLTIVAAIAIIAILIVSSFFAQLNFVQATTYNADNVSVTGVLATDSYVLYPYEEYNLVWGFSKYGEMINGAASPKLGLKYRDMDVFANSHVAESDWSQGWFIDLHYADAENRYTRAWAFAMYADQSGTGGIGGSWKEACTGEPTGSPSGGRKTNVWATTDPIEILYDGPRRFVALTKTTLYGAATKTTEDGLVSISITFVFNKDKKVVILYKDIKRLDQGKFGKTFQVEFSNRGEWDIGITSAPPSYAYFYDDLATNYDYEYHAFYSNTSTCNVTGFDVCQMINQAGTYVGFAAFWPPLFGKLVDSTTHIGRSTILSSLCTVVKNQTWLSLGSFANKTISFGNMSWTSSDAYPIGGGTASDEPMVFQNGVLLTGGGNDYTWTGYTTDTIEFVTEPLDTDYITIVYKHGIRSTTYCNMYTVGLNEPATPYVIGEWCFDLKNEENKKQFRAVTAYGLTDRHDADDVDAHSHGNAQTWAHDTDVIDCEVQYLLNETFNPYDLYSAVHKQEYRWVNITTSTSATTTYNLTTGINDQLCYVSYSPDYTYGLGATSPAWTRYFIRDSGNVYPVNSTWVNAYEDGTDRTAHSKNWCLELNATGQETLKITPIVGTPTSTAPLTLQLKDLVDFGFWYKMIAGGYGPSVQIKVTEHPDGNESAGNWANLKADWYNPIATTGCWHHYTLNNISSYVSSGFADTPFYDAGGGGCGFSGWHSYEYWTSHLGEYYVSAVMITMDPTITGVGSRALIDDLSVAYLNRASGIRYERVYNMEEDKLIPTDWDAYCSFSEKVMVDGALIDRSPNHLLRNYTEGGNPPYYTINFETGVITFYHYDVSQGYHLWALPIGTRLKILYSTIEENEKGRYEWLVVGRDASTIDSLGAAYVSEAFDSIKDIDVLTMGMDVNETRWGPLAPFVMGGAASGTRADYRDSLGRPHLRDDWCTNIAVASSDMIFVGGPIAQLGTEYFNEFTDIFFASSAYVTNDTGQSNKIFALSCWNKNATGSGYATIGVYKDLNGTIGLVIWGFDGQDTYYASKWFWDGLGGTPGIVQLQSMNRGVTSIMLEITYPTADPTHPTISIVERVGTISEKDWHDP